MTRRVLARALARARARALARTLVVAIAGGGSGACFYDVTPGLDGLRCDDAHTCVAGFSCVGGVCIADAEVPSAVSLEGAFAKGPFVIGSTITVAALGDDGAPTGQVFPTQTTSDGGDFTISIAHRGVVSVEGEGFYYNEATGALSQAAIVLRAAYDVGDGAVQKAYVNVITHLAEQRSLALFTSGSDLADASSQAETELVAGLGVGAAGPQGAGTSIALAGDDADAYLLALSAVLAQAAVIEAGGVDGPVDASLQELLNTIAIDLADDGDVSADIRTRLDDAEAAVDIEQVVSDLQQRFIDAGSDATVPDISVVIDEDGDLQAHTFDNCPFVANPGQEDSDGDGVGDACECGNGAIDAGEDCDGDNLPDNTPEGATCDAECHFVGPPNCVEAGGDCSTGPCCNGLDCVDQFCSGAGEGEGAAGEGEGAAGEGEGEGAACANDGAACVTNAQCCSSFCNGTTGSCEPACGPGEQQCADGCFDLSQSGTHCGSCTVVCGGATSQCINSQCAAPSSCGDAVKSGTEICDGDDFGGASCSSFGFGSGALACLPNCTVDPAGCAGAEACDAQDNDADGLIDECCDFGQQCGFNDIGQCITGIADCQGGASTCPGSVGPVGEICGNTIDDDCDGVIDEAPCT